MYMEKFSTNLKYLLKGCNMTFVAKEIGMSQQTLSRYASGQNEISLENLCKIADYFNEDLDILVGRREY